MTMTRCGRPAGALLVLLALWPTLALAQGPRAGVVTTLKGSATATRVALPQPVPLKFKDDVFLQDRVATADQSLARLLLGGKAVVTIRERSLLTITEVPDRSTLNLQTGKIALAVAREKMRPGEVIDIRTPNAIAAVRGTVVVVETKGGVTTVYVLSDPTGHGVEVTLLDPGTGATIGTPITLFALQSYSTDTARIDPISQDQVAGIIGDLQADPPHVAAANVGTLIGVLIREAQGDATVVLGNPEWPRGPVPPSILADLSAVAGVCITCPPPILPGNRNIPVPVPPVPQPKPCPSFECF
jgi:hypothetical protein